jgi:Domain of unknown function (DUF1707)
MAERGDGGGDQPAAGAGGVEGGPKASDADRDRLALRLQEQYGRGRLTEDELDKRLAQVYAARTLVELYSITSDLQHPGPRPVVGWRPGRKRWWRRGG